MELVQVVVLLVLIGCALVALGATDLLVAVILFGAFSYGSAILFALMNAVDVGFVEAIIGTVMSLIYISVLFGLERRSSR
ncbi:Na(+)/H(+) antiporter subunit B [Candidatus Desulforudis audaxviator]|uniref:Putative multicomponent Na+:H+ antiporter subunit B n=1 Tax=Desulforudis audaxviator (strain MP104C) TaxID=477974 RepID=B1I6G9_DESAP|nr:hydrogenase subunit MbhD domain-containing protein [Candidatus Desulforudis audaxviator]ACA60652.1 putative multicomponent Na+:H+ antiporter subunit B [Candidatus Desulforudis audaxviator MP104C]AZK60735.1 monovalent cation/H+ antiporter subunit B [Candidatus Desulforudis audaxviator]